MHPGEVIAILITGTVALSIVITIGVTWHHARKAKHLERMAMIEKGMHPDGPEGFDSNRFRVPGWMKVSSTMAGLGVGFVAAGVLGSWFPAMEEPMTFGSLLLMGGLGMSFPYFMSAYFQTHGENRG